MFEQIKNIIVNHTSTVTFYIFICILVVGFGYASDRCHVSIRIGHKYHINVFLFISLIVMWFVLAFSTCGADYDAYRRIFLRATSAEYWADTDVEYGYMLLNFLVRLFTDKFVIFRVIWASFYIGMFYCSIKKYSKYLSNYIAILAFACMFLFQPMSLMRIYFAAIILLWGFDYLLRRQYLKSVVVVLLCCSIHISAAIMLLPIAFVFLSKRKGNYWLKMLVVASFVVFIFLCRQPIFSALMPEKYITRYSVRKDVLLGFSKIAFFVPMLVPFYFIKKKRLYELYENNESSTMFSYVLICIATGFMSSIVEGISRTFCFFMPVYIIVPSYFLSLIKKSDLLTLTQKRNYMLVTRTLCVLYLVFRGLFMIEYLETDALTPFTNLFGLIV